MKKQKKQGRTVDTQKNVTFEVLKKLKQELDDIREQCVKAVENNHYFNTDQSAINPLLIKKSDAKIEFRKAARIYYNSDLDLDNLEKMFDKENEYYNGTTDSDDEVLEKKDDDSIITIEIEVHPEISQKEMENYFNEAIPLKKKIDRANSKEEKNDLENQLALLAYNKLRLPAFTMSGIERAVDEEIERRKTIARQEKLKIRCYKAIATLERKISNLDDYMSDTLWRSIKKDKRKRAIDLDGTYGMHRDDETAISYAKKGN